jgi:hypothetical protein
MVNDMPQRNSQRRIARMDRLPTIAGLSSLRGQLLLALVLVLLITSGGAG